MATSAPATRPRAILITGCSSGIGYEAARTLAGRGWRVLATARRSDDRDRVARELGVETLPLELSDQASIAACAAEALRLTGNRLDALYNNAAYGLIGAMEDITGEQLRRHLEVNVVGTHELTRRVIPVMRAAGSGRIVNCSSVLGFVSGPYRGPYCASKFALEAMTDAMRYELAGTGIHVSLLEPGPVRTEFLASTLATFRSGIDIDRSPHRAAYEKRLAAMADSKQQRRRLGPEAVVAKLIHALESPRPKARYMVSTATYAASVLKRALPGRALDALLRRS
jgi:NAD(P)-dependent dehydrogenase (short-subunit alcohol dehydrogenase family)